MSAVAAADGKWRVNLNSMSASTVPSTMNVSSGAASVSFTGVQVGEVWVCSGQSNLGKPLSYANGGSVAINDAANHNLRLFCMTAGNGPATTTWQVSGPTTAADFSAVCYWAGLELSEKFVNIPVGLIQATHDGTSITQWTHLNGGNGADYDAMVKAIQPYAVKGVGWYQGESDAGDNTYDVKLTGMINEVARRLVPSRPAVRHHPVDVAPERLDACARGATARVAKRCQHVPRRHDGHPCEQLSAPGREEAGRDSSGHRGRGAVYGEAIEYSGPVPNTATSFVSGNTVVINFTHVGGLFTGNGGAPGPFKIAGSNGRFVDAPALIGGNAIHVSSPNVSAPKIVRYQWDYGLGNLFNHVSVPTEGGTSFVDRLPASQFELKFP